MNASKFFITTAAAAAVVGAIGLAYAQTSPSTDASSTAPGPGAVTTPSVTTTTTPSTTTTTPSSTTTTITPPLSNSNAQSPSVTTTTTPSAATPTTSATDPLMRNQPMGAGNSDAGLSNSRTPGNPSSDMATERAARADRN